MRKSEKLEKLSDKIMEWIDEYIKEENKETVYNEIHLQIQYFLSE